METHLLNTIEEIKTFIKEDLIKIDNVIDEAKQRAEVLFKVRTGKAWLPRSAVELGLKDYAQLIEALAATRKQYTEEIPDCVAEIVRAGEVTDSEIREVAELIATFLIKLEEFEKLSSRINATLEVLSKKLTAKTDKKYFEISKRNAKREELASSVKKLGNSKENNNDLLKSNERS